MYANLTPYLARARFNDRLARAEAQRLATTAKQAQSRRQRARIPMALRPQLLRPVTRRPAT
jgi:hypothetical protein